VTDEHPLDPFMPTEAAAAELAARVRCSVPHLRNIRDGRKSASLGLAKRLSDHTGLPMDAFLRPSAEAAEAAQ
jgi:hypothetical protein